MDARKESQFVDKLSQERYMFSLTSDPSEFFYLLTLHFQFVNFYAINSSLMRIFRENNGNLSVFSAVISIIRVMLLKRNLFLKAKAK